MLELLLYWLLALVVHEGGHVLCAAILRLRIQAVSIGLGFGRHNLASFQLAGTAVRIGYVPVAAYTAIGGSHGPASEVPVHASLFARPWWQRSLVLLSGIGANILACLLASAVDAQWTTQFILVNAYLATISSMPWRRTDVSRFVDAIALKIYMSRRETMAAKLVLAALAVFFFLCYVL